MNALSSFGGHGRRTTESRGRLDKKAKSHHDALWRAWYTGLQTITIPAFSMNTLHNIQTNTPPIIETMTTSTTSTPSLAVLQSFSGSSQIFSIEKDELFVTKDLLGKVL